MIIIRGASYTYAGFHSDGHILFSCINFIHVLSICRGGWDTEGVTVVANDIRNSVIACSSMHLTSFAVLVDVSDGRQVRYLD